MDGGHFDDLTRDLAAPANRRGILLGVGGGGLVAVLGGFGLSALTAGDVDAKKKKKKKKKKKVKRCPFVYKTCSSSSECCGTQSCQSVIPGGGCDSLLGSPFCCGNIGDLCESGCDCCGDLFCFAGNCQG